MEQTKKPVSKEQFFADVEEEVRRLKEHCTQEEIEKLDINEFSFTSPLRCVYGQLAGSCESDRAKELMSKCCLRIWVTDKDSEEEDVNREIVNVINKKGFTDAIHLLNGSYDEEEVWKPDTAGLFRRNRDYTALSALEGYICHPSAKIGEIYAFLQGKTETLNLDFRWD